MPWLIDSLIIISSSRAFWQKISADLALCWIRGLLTKKILFVLRVGVHVSSISSCIEIILIVNKSLLNPHIELILPLLQCDFVDCILNKIDLDVIRTLENRFVLWVSWSFSALDNVFFQIVGLDEQHYPLFKLLNVIFERSIFFLEFGAFLILFYYFIASVLSAQFALLQWNFLIKILNLLSFCWIYLLFPFKLS